MKYLKAYRENFREQEKVAIPYLINTVILTLANYKRLLASRGFTNKDVRPLLEFLKQIFEEPNILIETDLQISQKISEYQNAMGDQDEVVIAFGSGVLRKVLYPVSRILEYYKNMMKGTQTGMFGSKPYVPGRNTDLWYKNKIRTYTLTQEIKTQYVFYKDQFTRAIDIVSDLILFWSTKPEISKEALEKIFKFDESDFKIEVWDQIHDVNKWDGELKLWHPPELSQER